MCFKRAARIFKNFKESSEIYSELPSKRYKGGGLNTIEVPLPLEGETLQYYTITDPPTIKKEILRQNKRHFRQAEATHLAGDDVCDTIGWGATTPTTNKILAGTANINAITTDPASKRLLEQFHTSKPDLEIEVTIDKMINRYKKWNERTATSPLGRHLGHFHALFRSFKYDLDDLSQDKAMMEEKRDLIINVHFMMLQIAAKNQHVYAWWKNILTCMIEKDSGSSKIRQLRVIHLYECDLNLLLGLYMREMHQHCEDNYLLNKGLYRGRPGQRSIDPVIVNVTQVEIAMITCQILVRFNNDATACFDRIMPHILCLCLQSYQIPTEFT